MEVDQLQRLKVIDSHTGGEPTRVILSGGPDLGNGPLAERTQRFREKHEAFRRAVITEPRGSDVLVGALLCEPSDPSCAAAVIFFNNVDVLGMCGHGMIGLAVTLAHLGRIAPGEYRIETPVGAVGVRLHDHTTATISNVPSHRASKDVQVKLPNGSVFRGDVAWGGNWFFLVSEHGQELALRREKELTAFTIELRDAVRRAGFPDVDHVELFGPPREAGSDSQNFVLCPGGAYDRSPCGTGTSAKLACLAADGKLAEDAAWIQESIIMSTFMGRYRWLNREKGIVAPQITGTAYITSEATLVFDPKDPFCWGIRP